MAAPAGNREVFPEEFEAGPVVVERDHVPSFRRMTTLAFVEREELRSELSPVYVLVTINAFHPHVLKAPVSRLQVTRFTGNGKMRPGERE